MPPPAKKNRGGRPRIVWSVSRCRKLIRLYLMTDLTLDEIKAVLCSDGFSCSKRHIQDRLKDWIPNIKERWREHRPSPSHRKSMQKNRLLQFSQSNTDKLSKYQRIQSRLRRDRDEVQLRTTSSGLQPLPRAREAPTKSPSKSTIRTYNDIHRTAKTSSISIAEPLSLKNLNHFSVETASQILTEQSNHTHSVDKDFSCLTADEDTTYGLNTLNRLKRRPDDAWSISSGKTSLRASIASRSPDSIRHIKAVIERSISWCSSTLYASSIASSLISNQSRIFLSRHESLVWEELIDDTCLSSGSKIPNYKEISLQFRPCCQNFSNEVICEKCGARQAHRLARLNNYDLIALENLYTTDLFGNNVLHHAGAGGNLQGVSQYLSQCTTAVLLHDRNTSGETFLHVLSVSNRAQIPHYVSILKMASNLNFSFGQRDHHGRTVGHIFQLLTRELDFESAMTDEVYHTMNISGTWLDNQGNQFTSPTQSRSSQDFSTSLGAHEKDAPIISREVGIQHVAREYDENGDTSLISAIKSWTAHPLTHMELSQLIDKADVNSRDRRGYTALAISVSLGLYCPSLALLRKGANPNTRSYKGTGVYARCTNYAARAARSRDNSLYATIMTCANLLADHGALAKPTPYDEFAKRDLESNDTSRNDIKSIPCSSPDIAHRAQTPADNTSTKYCGHMRPLRPPALIPQCERKVIFVDSLVSFSAQIIEAIWPLSSISSRSETTQKGVLPLRNFIRETLRRSRTSYSTLQVALYYLILIKPHVPKPGIGVEQPQNRTSTQPLHCGRRMFLAALILASKYLQDKHYSIRGWSKISGLESWQIHRNEMAFLSAINWKLHIRDAVFQQWTDIVLKNVPQHPPPIFQCRPEFNNVEVVSSSTSTRAVKFPISDVSEMLQKFLAMTGQLEGELSQSSKDQNGIQSGFEPEL